jgi:hypothetical protein
MRHLIPLHSHQVQTDHLPLKHQDTMQGETNVRVHTYIGKLIDNLLHIVLIPYHSGNR